MIEGINKLRHKLLAGRGPGTWALFDLVEMGEAK